MINRMYYMYLYILTIPSLLVTAKRPSLGKNGCLSPYINIIKTNIRNSVAQLDKYMYENYYNKEPKHVVALM